MLTTKHQRKSLESAFKFLTWLAGRFPSQVRTVTCSGNSVRATVKNLNLTIVSDEPEPGEPTVICSEAATGIPVKTYPFNADFRGELIRQLQEDKDAR